MSRTRIGEEDIFSCFTSVSIPTAGEPLDKVIVRLIDAGFTDQQILERTFPTHDRSRNNPRRENFLRKIRYLREQTEEHGPKRENS